MCVIHACMGRNVLSRFAAVMFFMRTSAACGVMVFCMFLDSVKLCKSCQCYHH